MTLQAIIAQPMGNVVARSCWYFLDLAEKTPTHVHRMSASPSALGAEVVANYRVLACLTALFNEQLLNTKFIAGNKFVNSISFEARYEPDSSLATN